MVHILYICDIVSLGLMTHRIHGFTAHIGGSFLRQIRSISSHRCYPSAQSPYCSLSSSTSVSPSLFSLSLCCGKNMLDVTAYACHLFDHREFGLPPHPPHTDPREVSPWKCSCQQHCRSLLCHNTELVSGTICP